MGAISNCHEMVNLILHAPWIVVTQLSIIVECDMGFGAWEQNEV
jgi:hypothetical protein